MAVEDMTKGYEHLSTGLGEVKALLRDVVEVQKRHTQRFDVLAEDVTSLKEDVQVVKEAVQNGRGL